MNIPDASLYLTADQQKEVLHRDDLRGLWEVLKTWGLLFGAFAAAYYWAHPLVIFICMWVIGGRQLGCSIIMHDTSHKSLFRTSWMNDFFGKWMGGHPILNDMLRYRPYHVKHHVHTGLEEDPDTNLTRGYPAGWKSMVRKFGRDLIGLTGIKGIIALVMMHLNYLEYDQGNNPQRIDQSNRTWSHFFRTAFTNLSGAVVANIILFGVISILFAPWVYLLWVGAFLTTFQVCIRVRAIAEHSMIEDKTDPYENTRTTYANPFEKLLFAPHNVNYHAEHHMLMGVPCYNLPKMHRYLLDKDYFEKGTLAKGYWQIISMAARKRG